MGTLMPFKKKEWYRWTQFNAWSELQAKGSYLEIQETKHVHINGHKNHMHREGICIVHNLSTAHINACKKHKWKASISSVSYQWSH